MSRGLFRRDRRLAVPFAPRRFGFPFVRALRRRISAPAAVLLLVHAGFAHAVTFEWMQRQGGAGIAMDSGGQFTSSGGSNRLHPAVDQAISVLNATDGSSSCAGSACLLTSGYLAAFPARPNVDCHMTSSAGAACAQWTNSNPTNFIYANHRHCSGNDCGFYNGNAQYYRYIFTTSSTYTDASINTASAWSDAGAKCPGGSCTNTANTRAESPGEGKHWLHVRSYNGGMIGGSQSVSFDGSNGFGVDRTAPTVAWTSPAASNWFNANFSASTAAAGDVDPTSGGVSSGISACQYRVLSNAVETVAWAARTCNSTQSVTVGAAANCKDRGKDKCEVQLRANDVAGNTGSTYSRSFGIDWLIDYINNSVSAAVSGFPNSSTTQSGAYIGTITAAGNVIYLLDGTATTVTTLSLGAGETVVGAPYWSPTSTAATDNYIYIGTNDGSNVGRIYRIRNNDTASPGSPAGNVLSVMAGWPITLPNKCGGAAIKVSSPVTVDAKLVYVGASDPDCAGDKNYIFAYELTTTSYEGTDVGGDGVPDRIVDVTGCTGTGTNQSAAPTAKGAWTGPRYLHIGSDCSDGELYRIRVDTGYSQPTPIGTADCQRDVAGEIQAWMTGFNNRLFFGTLGGAAARFYAIQNTESTAACPSTAYSDLAGFPYTPAGGTNITRGAMVNWAGPTDEAYFVDTSASGRLYCVCQLTGTGCASVGGDCNGYPVQLESGASLGEPILYNGTVYVVSSTGKVYAREALYDPSCSANNCDGTASGAEVGSAQGYGAAANVFNFATTVSSATAIMNSGTVKVALGTDAGRVFYLPVVP